MWDPTDGCTEQYNCSFSIYLLMCLSLELYINIYRLVVASTQFKDVVDGVNVRDKLMLELAMAKLLKSKLN